MQRMVVVAVLMVALAFSPAPPKEPTKSVSVSWPTPKEPLPLTRYTVCGIAGAENCWEVVGTPIR
jgi:hypothetical protein